MEIQGCYVALVTPFLDDGSVDEEGLRKNIGFLIRKGVAGIVPCGTTGESATLSWDEHNHVVDIAIDEAGKRVQVISGAGSNNTAESIKAARHAREQGADAILCITPYYNKPTQEGIFRHFKMIADEVDIGIVVYNVPGRTGTNIVPETIERLCELSNIVAVKEASGNVGQISEIHRRCGDRLTILSGDDALTLPILACGGKGVISVVGNILPDTMAEMIALYLQSDTAGALRVHEELLPVCKALFFESNPIPVKTAMEHLGHAAGPLRLPLTPMSESNKQKLLAVIQKSGVSGP
ncbi:MAG: 4-hydroxy-tetrahydrodipicolinate synthase [Chitinivibrionales bacterium]|nr:4-hydroxy-tetrahydrodipicolinate synthase [Chitinivibrionales bacterium]